MPLFLGHDHFLVGEGGLGGGIPVNHPFAAVDQAAVIKLDEHAQDALGIMIVHGEPFAAPIARASEFLELLDDDPAMFLFPVPDFLEESLAAEIVAVGDGFLLAQRFLDHGLGGDPGMIGAR